MEIDIAFLAKAVGDSRTSEHYTKASKARKKAIDCLFWNPKMGQWFDYWFNDTCNVGPSSILLHNRIDKYKNRLSAF